MPLLKNKISYIPLSTWFYPCSVHNES